MRHKCANGIFCTLLHRRLDPINARHKGLVPIKTMQASTGQSRLVGVAYKVNARDKGIMLNHCPFCGESLKWWEPNEVEKGTSEKEDQKRSATHADVPPDS